MVDDDFAARGLLSLAFERAGIDVDVAEDGVQAVDLLARNGANYCTVVLDLHIPPPDGIDVARHIALTFPGLPVIVVSGRPDLSVQLHDGTEISRTVKLLISKPVDPTTVADVVHSHCLRAPDSSTEA